MANKGSEISGSVDEFDPKTILTALCASAQNTEIRDCLRRYNPEDTFKNQQAAFDKFNKPILVETANYLQVDTEGMLKDAVIQELICNIQVLLPETCPICKEKYKTNLGDAPGGGTNYFSLCWGVLRTPQTPLD